MLQYKSMADCHALSRATVRRGLIGNAGSNENHVCSLIKRTYYEHKSQQLSTPRTKLNSLFAARSIFLGVGVSLIFVDIPSTGILISRASYTAHFLYFLAKLTLVFFVIILSALKPRPTRHQWCTVCGKRLQNTSLVFLFSVGTQSVFLLLESPFIFSLQLRYKINSDHSPGKGNEKEKEFFPSTLLRRITCQKTSSWGTFLNFDQEKSLPL